MERLTEADKKAIEAAVHEAEGKTSGEIVPVVVPTSANYSYVGHWVALAGVALATATLLAVPSWSANLWDVKVLLLAQAMGWGLGWSLGHFPPVVRALAGGARMSTEVEETALASFLHNGVHRTEKRTGILVFVSLLERKVVILADEGIHALEGDDLWHGESKKIAAGLSKGKGAAAIADAILSLGTRLSAHFPAQAGHRSQLPNTVQDR